METLMKKAVKFSQSITLKAFVVAAITMFMLIPSFMIQNLIRERQQRSIETIEKINDKWSNEQTFVGPILSIPVTIANLDNDKRIVKSYRTLHITPDDLLVNVELFPDAKRYGIYKAILYKSKIAVSGTFSKPENLAIENGIIHWDEAYISIGVSDLRGITSNATLNINNHERIFEVGSNSDHFLDKALSVEVEGLFDDAKSQKFNLKLDLNGSKSINFVPVGKTSVVNVSGEWASPGFIGNFSPESNISNDSFSAHWSIMRFNRNIPEMWFDNNINSFHDSEFGVMLVKTVDHYQQNMRSAKYAFMFIALTFVVFFFVEIITGKKIHPVQYVLVAAALILFYSLLLSLSEQLGFGISYAVASVATIGMITAYAHSIFKNKTHTALLAIVLTGLYIFLYVVLQLEDVALMIGSIGLFLILGIIMYLSRKINWYKDEKYE